MTRRFDDRCHKLAEYSIGAAEETVNLGQGIGDRRGRNCRFSHGPAAVAHDVDETHRYEDFNFVRGGDFSGDGGGWRRFYRD